MKVLWIVNTIFPELARNLDLPETVYGGWMYGLADYLSSFDNIELIIATVHDGNYIEKEINKKLYILIPIRDKKAVKLKWKEINSKFNPDIVHIHGTEFDHGLLYLQANSANNVIVSLQGLISVISKYYYSDIAISEIIKNITIKDFLKRSSIIDQKRIFTKRGIKEKEYFKLSKNIIGRTYWDKAHTYFLNSDIQYFFCNEILRDSFYKAEKWQYNKCIKHSIFLSQASYPIKGLHIVLKAVNLIKNEFPNILIRIGGQDIIKKHTFIDKVKMGNYGRYIQKLINKYNLQDNIIFLGNLNEKQMIDEYLSCNTFICPSSIENSPNSLCEAQLLGVPNISSYVGGVPSIVKDGINGFLYRFEDVEMLAYIIKEIFEIKKLDIFSKQSIIDAEKRHNKIDCINQILSIYKSVGKND